MWGVMIKQRRFLGGLGVVAIAAATAGLLLWRANRAAEAERNSIAGLRQLGAVVVLDSDRQHAAAANLAPLTDPDQLDAAIQLIPHLYKLVSLEVRGTDLSESQLRTLALTASLESLTLNACGISTEEARVLTRLAQLKTLYLSENNIEKELLPDLAPLKRLKILDLSATQITNGLEPITALPALEWLLLRELQLEPGALKGLARCRLLKRLTLNKTSVPSEEWKGLQAEINGLAVDVEAGDG